MSKEPKRNVYVGHRYVPLIIGEWDKQETYEGLSIVTYQGTSYTSKKRVPVGVDILNEEYWVVTGNYNAQVDQYRQEVSNMKENVNSKADKVYVENEINLVNDSILKIKNDLNDRFISVANFGAIGDFDIETNEGTDNHTAFTEASNYAKENGVDIFVPEGNYKIDGHLTIYDSIYGNGKLFFPNENSNARLTIQSKKIPIELDPNSIEGLKAGSNKIEGLGNDYKGYTLVIESDEVLINRYNPPNNTPYTKNETAKITSKVGHILPSLDFNYNKQQIKSIIVTPPEDKLIISIDIYGYGSINKSNNVIVNNRSNVNFIDFNLSSEKNFKTGININNCVDTLFSGVNVSNCVYDGFGYGISIGNTSFTTLLNCNINDCREVLSGRHGKNVLVIGGSYDGVIDSHWGSNYVFQNISFNGYFQYAGKDISITSCKGVLTHSDLLRVRTDTPELYGKVIIEKNEFNLYGEEINHIKLFTFPQVTKPNKDDVGRRLRTPELLDINKNKINIPKNKRVWVNFGNVNYEQYAPKTINIDNNELVNGNNLLIQMDATENCEGITDLFIQNQDMNGSKNDYNIVIRDLRTSNDINRLYNVKITNCKDVSSRIDPSPMIKYSFLSSNLVYVSPTTFSYNEYDGMWAINCSIDNAVLGASDMHFIGCVFSGDLTWNTGHTKLLSGCYAKEGSTGIPELDLMSYNRGE